VHHLLSPGVIPLIDGSIYLWREISIELGEEKNELWFENMTFEIDGVTETPLQHSMIPNCLSWRGSILFPACTDKVPLCTIR